MSNKDYTQEAYSFKKRVSFFFLFSFFFFLFSFSQNLIPNGSFEVLSSCPQIMGQIGNATGWSNPEPLTDPDYFNSCSSYSTSVSVPDNGYGYQPDCSAGAAYSGIWVFNFSVHNDGRDYIQAKLIDTLKQWHKYVATAHVSLSNYSAYAIASIGLYFTPNAVQGPSNVGFINVLSPQVKGKFPLTDTLNWMAVQDTFVAQGGELYLTIGNFSADSLSDTTTVLSSGFNGSYYYVDSVTVYDTGLIGVSEIEKEDVSINIFPNPSNGHFEIDCSLNQDATLEISDLQGRLLERKTLSGHQQRTGIICENLASGVYLYRVIADGVSRPPKKLIVVK